MKEFNSSIPECSLLKIRPADGPAQAAGWWRESPVGTAAPPATPLVPATARSAVLAFLQDSWHASMGAQGGGWGVVGWASPRCTGGWCPIFTLKSSQDYWVKRDMFWFMCTHVLHRNDCSEDWSSCEGTSSQISAGPRHQPHRSFYVYLALPHAALWLFHFLCLFLFIV